MVDDDASSTLDSLKLADFDPREAETRPIERHSVLRELQSRLFGRAKAELVLGGRYVLKERLGAGGFGAVYRAYDPALERDVAVKVLRGTTVDPTEGAALLAESRTIAALDHPNVVRVFDVGLDEDFEPGPSEALPTVYVVLELLVGRPLSEWISSERPDTTRLLDTLVGAGRGVAAVHDAGIVHGDIKPANIVVDADGDARVVDFGLAHHVGRELETTERNARVASSRQSARFVRGGTPAYMAPEATLGGDPTFRGDQYSLALVIAEALAGRLPFPGTRDDLPAEKLRGVSPGQLATLGLAAAPARVLARALSPRPEDRFASVGAMLDALARPAMRGTAAWIALGVVGASALFLSPDEAAQCDAFRRSARESWAEQQPLIRERFERWSTPYAEELGARVVAKVDELVDSWETEASRFCRDRSVDTSETDRTELCLDGRLREIETVLQILAEGNAVELEHSLDVIAKVGAPEYCAPALVERAMISGDPAMQAAASRLRGDLFRTRAQLAAGNDVEARALASRVQLRAEALELAPVEAEATYELGNAQCALGRFADGIANLERAYFSAETLGHDRLMAAASTRLVMIAGRQLQDADLALRWGEWARAAVARISDNGEATAALEYALGVVALRRGDLELGFRQHEHALDLYRKLGDTSSVAACLNGLAVVHKERGQLDDALPLLEQVYQLEVERLGEHHPHVTTVASNLGLTALELGDIPRAESMLAQVVDSRRSSLGPDHPDVAAAVLNLSVVDYTRGRYSQALEQTNTATAVIEAALGEHPMLALALDNAGVCRRGEGHADLAVPLHRRALQVQHDTMPPGHPQTATTLTNLGLALALAGHPADADAEFNRARTILGADPSEAATILRLFTAIAQEQRGADGRTELKRGLRELGERPRPVLGYATFALARAERAHGNESGAIAAANRAREVFASLSNETDGERVERFLLDSR